MSNNVIVIGNRDIPEDIRTELPDVYNETKISDQDDLKNKTNSGTDASYAVITEDLSIFFGIKENSVNEELVICFRALMDLENAIVFAKRNTNNDIKRTYKKAGFYHVTNTNWADLTYGKFRLQYKENETIDRNDTDWYDFSGRYNLYKLRNLLKEEDNNKDEVKKKIERVISKIDKEKEKMAGYWGVFDRESTISMQMDNIQNKIKDLLENIKKAEQTNIRNKDNLEKNNEDVKKLIDELTGNLNKQKHSGLIKLLENAENQIDTLVTKAKDRSDQVLIQQLQTVINDLEGKNNSPFVMPERVGTLTVVNASDFNSNTDIVKNLGSIPGSVITTTVKMDVNNRPPWGKEYFVWTTGKKYFKYTFPKTPAQNVELPFIPGIKKGETFAFYASEPGRGLNITQQIFFEEDIIKAEITKKDSDTLGITLKGEINEKYKKNENSDFTVLLEYKSLAGDRAIDFKIKGKQLQKTMEQKLDRNAIDDIEEGDYFLIPAYDSNKTNVNAAFVSGLRTNISDYINLDGVCEDADVCMFPCTNDVYRGQCLSDDFTGRDINDKNIYEFLEKNVDNWEGIDKYQKKELKIQMRNIILDYLGIKGKTRKEVRGMMNKPWLTFGNVFSSAWKLLVLTPYAMNVHQTYNHFNQEARKVPWEHRCNLDVTQVGYYFNQTKNSIEDYGYDDIENKAIEQVYSLLNPHAQSCRNRTIPGTNIVLPSEEQLDFGNSRFGNKYNSTNGLENLIKDLNIIEVIFDPPPLGTNEEYAVFPFDIKDSRHSSHGDNQIKNTTKSFFLHRESFGYYFIFDFIKIYYGDEKILHGVFNAIQEPYFNNKKINNATEFFNTINKPIKKLYSDIIFPNDTYENENFRIVKKIHPEYNKDVSIFIYTKENASQNQTNPIEIELGDIMNSIEFIDVQNQNTTEPLNFITEEMSNFQNSSSSSDSNINFSQFLKDKYATYASYKEQIKTMRSVLEAKDFGETVITEITKNFKDINWNDFANQGKEYIISSITNLFSQSSSTITGNSSAAPVQCIIDYVVLE